MTMRFIFLALCLPAMMAVSAPRAPENLNLTITGTIIVDPPCVINNNNPINITFDTMKNTDVNGVNGAKPLGPVFNCSSAISSALKYHITGTGTAWDGNALTTDRDNLGIRITQGQNGSTVALNADVPFQSTSLPDLWAVPVKNAAMLPVGGTYNSAAATLTVDYQ
jgi:type 1 fimbria pilin